MPTLTPEQIARHAYGAGFRGQDLVTITAIALAESGGDPKAHNAKPPDNSYGLWQINMLGALGPDRRRALHISSNARLFDPAVNARAAWLVSGHGKSFRPWSVYLYGQYKRHLAVATKAARAVRANPGGRGSAPAGRAPARGRIVLDLPELHRLGRLFEHAADRVEHVRRAVRDVAADVEPARARLADPALGSLLQAVLTTLDAPTQLGLAASRLDRQGRYAERVRQLAGKADGDDGRWSTAEKVRFVSSLGTVDPYERAVLEALLGGKIVTASGSKPAPRGLPSPGVNGLANGRVPASRLVGVGDGERMSRAAGTVFRRMDDAARRDGTQLRVNSGYRTYAEQASLYEAYRNGRGPLAAPPGRSTHGLGLSADIDVTDPDTLRWLRRHADEYGFVNDVPSEPWHWTYRPSR